MTNDVTNEPANDLTGLVLGRDGQPAAGAEVHVRAPGDALRAVSSFWQQLDPRGPGRMPAQFKAGRDGRFTLPKSGQPLCVHVSHAEGYAVVTSADLEKSERVTLQKWGRIEGSLGPALRATADQEIVVQTYVDEDDGPTLRFYTEASVDASGRFVVDHVLPGRIYIYRRVRLLKLYTNGGFGGYGVLVDVAAGQTVVVQLGGRGIAVRGTAAPFAGLDFTTVLTRADLYLSYKTVMPPGFAQWSRDQLEKWGQSPESHAAHRELRRLRAIDHFGARVEADGRFVIPDVLPGKYTLSVSVTQPDPGPNWGPGKWVGSVSREIDISADAKADLDLGVLPLQLSLPIGAAAVARGLCYQGPAFAISDRGVTVIHETVGHVQTTWVAPTTGVVPIEGFSLHVEEGNPYAPAWMEGRLATRDGKTIATAFRGTGDFAATVAAIAEDDSGSLTERFCCPMPRWRRSRPRGVPSRRPPGIGGSCWFPERWRKPR